MNQPPASPGVRTPLLLGVLLVGVAAVAAILLLRPSPAPEDAPAPAAEAAAPTPGSRPGQPGYQRPKALHAVTGSGETAPEPPSPTTPEPALPPAAPAAVILPGNPQPTAETRGIVSALANLDLKNKPLTETDAAALKEGLHRLAQSGPAGAAAILEYLSLNKDISFEAFPGTAGLLGSPTLRLSLLQALSSMTGPEAAALAAATLSTTRDPREIALLAGSLDRQAPGEHRETALAAARAALAEASAGRLTGKDVGPLFDVLRNYGGAGAVTDFQAAAEGPWKYYATIALADLPDAAGVPALRQMITDPQNAAASSRIAALQAVAQLSADHADARNLLLEQARQGAIPAASWINVAAALAGDRFAIGAKSAEANPNLRTWHLVYGNQQFYAQPGQLSPDQIQQRLGLVDQFMTVAANNPAAVAALQNARNTLAGRLPTPPAP
ncbi:MAG: hypothetical protein RJA22_1233 [Verrucomicrobiota bacterium]|jgi:hypothetical protein